MERALNIVGSIVTVALVATALSPRAQTANVIRALGGFFTGALSTAKDLDG